MISFVKYFGENFIGEIFYWWNSIKERKIFLFYGNGGIVFFLDYSFWEGHMVADVELKSLRRQKNLFLYELFMKA